MTTSEMSQLKKIMIDIFGHISYGIVKKYAMTSATSVKVPTILDKLRKGWFRLYQNQIYRSNPRRDLHIPYCATRLKLKKHDCRNPNHFKNSHRSCTDHGMPRGMLRETAPRCTEPAPKEAGASLKELPVGEARAC